MITADPAAVAALRAHMAAVGRRAADLARTLAAAAEQVQAADRAAHARPAWQSPYGPRPRRRQH